jgi:hypothetical protein
MLDALLDVIPVGQEDHGRAHRSDRVLKMRLLPRNSHSVRGAFCHVAIVIRQPQPASPSRGASRRFSASRWLSVSGIKDKPARNQSSRGAGVAGSLNHQPNGVDVCQRGEANSDLRFCMVWIHRLPEKWLPVSIAPSDIDLEVGVMDRGDVHALIFPIRKRAGRWVDAVTGRPVDIEPTHWRAWNNRGEL